MLDQDIDSDIEVKQNESDVDLDVENTDNIAGKNNIVQEILISTVNEGDSDESSENIGSMYWHNGSYRRRPRRACCDKADDPLFQYRTKRNNR